jgi:hypothetical protein
MKKLLILTSFFVLVTCVNTHKDLFVLEVNIETLKEMLVNQKCHNKAIFIFDPGCPTCMFYLRDEYPIMKNKYLDSIDYIFISVDTIQVERYIKFFNSIGIKAGHLFTLQENNSKYLQLDGKINISKVIQHLFPNEVDMYIKGFPVSAMANKANKLKLEYYLMDDSTFIIQPQPWHRLDSLSLGKIDFNKIDNHKK